MAEIVRLSGDRSWIDLGFVKRERTPEPAMALGIQSHLAGLSLSNTVELLANLQSEDGRTPNQVVVDETVIRINDKQFWLYAVTRARSVLVGERELRSRQRC